MIKTRQRGRTSRAFQVCGARPFYPSFPIAFCQKTSSNVQGHRLLEKKTCGGDLWRRRARGYRRHGKSIFRCEGGKCGYLPRLSVSSEIPRYARSHTRAHTRTHSQKLWRSVRRCDLVIVCWLAGLSVCFLSLSLSLSLSPLLQRTVSDQFVANINKNRIPNPRSAHTGYAEAREEGKPGATNAGL